MRTAFGAHAQYERFANAMAAAHRFIVAGEALNALVRLEARAGFAWIATLLSAAVAASEARAAGPTDETEFARLERRAEARVEDFWKGVEASVAREKRRMESRTEWLEKLAARERAYEQARGAYAARPKASFEARRQELERQREEAEQAYLARREREREEYVRARDRLRELKSRLRKIDEDIAVGIKDPTEERGQGRGSAK